MLTSPKVSGRTSIFNWWDKFELFQSGTLVYIQNEKCYLLKIRAPSSVLQDNKKISSINMINISWYATICIIVLQVCRCADRKHVLCSIVQLVKKKKKVTYALRKCSWKAYWASFSFEQFSSSSLWAAERTSSLQAMNSPSTQHQQVSQKNFKWEIPGKILLKRLKPNRTLSFSCWAFLPVLKRRSQGQSGCKKCTQRTERGKSVAVIGQGQMLILKESSKANLSLAFQGN